jgi:protein tyrosine phosphatase (PTP) superfamily phosphohydrolase (DUF442 family)
MNPRLVNWVAILVLLATCSASFSIQQRAAFVHSLNTKHLSNTIQVMPEIISGALPEQEASFSELRELGVKTIISVDGMRPNVPMAKKFGMRYVHLPNGYDGIPPDRVLELAKAIRDLPKPIYVHCHHGKHRSPAAVAAACRTLGLITHTQALDTLKLAGTNPGFQGLFESVRQSQPAADSVLDSLKVEFQETSPVPPMAEMMVSVDLAMSELIAARKQNWPKWDKSATDALMLKEHMVELGRLEDSQARGNEFQQLLSESILLSGSLESELRRAYDGHATADSGTKSSSLLARVESNCVRCHEQFRN